jgi:hypothetical protein
MHALSGIAQSVRLSYGLDNWGLIPSGSREFFFLPPVFRLAVGPTQPPIQWVLGALCLAVKWLGHEADHSPLFSAQVKNAWIYTLTPPYIFMAWHLVK